MRHFIPFLLGIALTAGVMLFGAAQAAPQSALPQAAPPKAQQQAETPTAPWSVLATGEAAATQAAGAFTQVAETTRVAGEAQASATAQRVSTLAARTETALAVTQSALMVTAQFERAQATRSADGTQYAGAMTATAAADMATAGAQTTRAAATHTAEFVAVVATESVRREQSATQWASAGAGFVEFFKLVLALSILIVGSVGAWYLMARARIDLEERKNRALMIETGWGPAVVEALPDGQIRINLLAPPPEARKAIAQQPRIGVGPQPKVAASRDDDPADGDLQRVLNLLAKAERVEGPQGVKIPRYHRIGYKPEVREHLVGLLEKAGLVSVARDQGQHSGTYLTNGHTLHSLWVDLRGGRITLTPSPTSGGQSKSAPTFTRTTENAG